MGRTPTEPVIEELVLQMARENRSWGYRRIVGAVGNLGHVVSHQTAANLLKRHGLAPSPERGKQMPWKEFIRSHPGNAGVRGFFHSGGLDGCRIADLLRAGVHADCAAPDPHRGDHSGAYGGVEEADCSQPVDGAATAF